MEELPFDLTSVEIEDASPTPEPPKRDVDKPKPSGKKPKYSVTRYARIPGVKTIDKFIVRNVNERFLENKKTKLTVKECEIGEAMMYLIEYYTAIDPYHPALVIIGAISALTLRTMELQGGPDAK